MPLPEHIRSATLVVGGIHYGLRNVYVTGHSFEQEFDMVRGGRGVVGAVARPASERVSFECELVAMGGVDSRDATLAAAFSVPPSAYTYAIPLDTSNVSQDVLRSLQRAVTRDVDRATTTLIGGPRFPDGLEDDASFRERTVDVALGRARNPPIGLLSATGADLDALAAVYGMERAPAAQPASMPAPPPEPEPPPSALDILLADDDDEEAA